MAGLRADLAELKRIYTRSVEINTETKNILTTWRDEIENVIANLEQGTPLGNASNRLKESLDKIIVKMFGDANTPGVYTQINEFFLNQVNKYDATQTDAKEYLDKLIENFSNINK